MGKLSAKVFGLLCVLLGLQLNQVQCIPPSVRVVWEVKLKCLAFPEKPLELRICMWDNLFVGGNTRKANSSK